MIKNYFMATSGVALASGGVWAFVNGDWRMGAVYLLLAATNIILSTIA